MAVIARAGFRRIRNPTGWHCPQRRRQGAPGLYTEAATNSMRPIPFCLLVLLVLTPVAGVAQGAPDWGNPAVFERGQVAPHATLMPFASAEAALTGDRKASPWCLLLTGTWKFRWVPNPSEAPTDFFRPGFDASNWDDIEVLDCLP